MLYATAIRLLSQNSVSSSDLAYARSLLLMFSQSYELHYQTPHMNFNVHIQNHLTKQTDDHGPLHKRSSYSLEGVFHMAKRMSFGTHGFAEQFYYFFTIDRYS